MAQLLTQNEIDQETSLTAGSNGNNTVTWGTAQVHGGTHSAQSVSVAAGTASTYYPNHNVAATAGTLYTASAWIYVPIACNVSLNMNWYDAAQAYLSTSAGGATAVSATTWTQVTYTIAAIATAFNCRPTVDWAATAAAQTAYADDFSLTDPSGPAITYAYAVQIG